VWPVLPAPDGPAAPHAAPGVAASSPSAHRASRDSPPHVDALPRLDAFRGFPPSCSSPCALSRQAAEALCPAAVHPLVHTLFPSTCGQLGGGSISAGAVPAAAVSRDSGPGPLSLALLAIGEARWPGAVAHARMDESVRQSAQRSADRSVQPRSHGRGAAGLPPPCTGLPGDVLAPHRLGNALEPTLRLASPRCPPRGTAGSTGAAALCPCR
jgi:hypothetical protein